VLDVRQLKEFESGHLENAIQLNFLDKAVFEKGIKDLDKSKNYYLYCRSGRRSNSAALMMKKEGFKVFDLKGGILAWEKTGLPILR
jgi:rhodanese-related sulfurtransferase